MQPSVAILGVRFHFFYSAERLFCRSVKGRVVRQV